MDLGQYKQQKNNGGFSSKNLDLKKNCEWSEKVFLFLFSSMVRLYYLFGSHEGLSKRRKNLRMARGP